MNQEPVHIIFLKVKHMKMSYENFKQEFKNRIRSYLPAEYAAWKVNVQTVYKVNVKLDGFSLLPPEEIRVKNEVHPVFYLQDLYEFYEEGVEFKRILSHIAGLILHTPAPKKLEETDFRLEDFEDCIVLQLINREQNLDLLKTLPHRNFLDLAVIYRILVVDEDGECSGMLVCREMMKEWNLKEKDLYQMAWKNTPEVLPFLLKSAGRIFQSGIVLEDGQDRMYILSNDGMKFGAAAMLFPDILEMAAEKFDSSYAILPGSIHELYLVKGTPEEAEFWRDVVETANQELVPPAEWLSNQIYYYNKEEKTVTIL